MKSPAFPAQEVERHASLCRLDILDTDPEEGFDRITRIAQAYFKVPIALVSLVDSERQWFKSRQGLDVAQTPRDISFCGHAILGEDIFCVPHTLEDPRFADNPLVTGPPNIRFYAGAPLSAPDGMKVGTLCIIDTKPRLLSAEDLRVLRDLADGVEHELGQAHVREISNELASQESRLRAVLDTVIDGIITIDQKGTIETFNPAAQRIFGYGVDEVFGHNIKMLMPEPYHGEHDGYLKNYQDSGKAKIIGIGREVVGRRKDGSTFSMELAVGKMEVGGARMFTGIVRDITERKQAEKLKMEFISTVSHELRTPLTSIKGSLGLIKSGAVGELPEKIKRMLEIAYNNSDRLVRLINDILDIEKVAAGKMDFHMRGVDLKELLEQAIEANKGYGAEHGVSFVLSGAVPDAHVDGDHDRLMQVLSNLMSNAAKFSPQGGSVKIAMAPSEKGVRVSVSDHGPGIPEDFQNKIFGKFSQADSSDTRQKGGTGLGLNITKAIVEQHGGTIGFETATDKGTTFFFDLPQRPGRAATAVTGAVSSPQYHVLICEDEPDISTLLEVMLQQDGFATDTARSAAQAEALLDKNTYDAMMLDLGLPDKDGIMLLRELRQKPTTKDLPIIVISANATKGAMEISGDAIGIVDWLEKPIDQERLSESLRRAVASSSDRMAHILHVEDDPDILQVVSALVEDIAQVVAAKTLSQAKSLLEQNHYDLVILDLMLPDGDGEELLPLLKRGSHKSTPVIVFSAKDVSDQTVDNIKTVLIKSRSSNEVLLAKIRSSIKALKPREENTQTLDKSGG